MRAHMQRVALVGAMRVIFVYDIPYIYIMFSRESTQVDAL